MSIKFLIDQIGSQVATHSALKVYGDLGLVGFGLTGVALAEPAKPYHHFLRALPCESEEDGAPQLLAQIQEDIAQTGAKEIFWRKLPHIRIAGPLDAAHNPTFAEGTTMIVARYTLA